MGKCNISKWNNNAVVRNNDSEMFGFRWGEERNGGSFEAWVEENRESAHRGIQADY